MSLIRVTDLTFSYEGSYDNIFENVSFDIDTDWKLGFTGRNGRGKTTFLNLLRGKYEYKGIISSNVSFDYFPPSVSDISQDTLFAVESLVPDYEYWRLVKELRLLGVDEEVLYRQFSTLSMGERTKVLIVVLFLKENNFLLIDEPTNHLDTRGRELVAGYLNRKKGFIVVSHDRFFLDSCTDHTLSINKTDIEVVRGGFSAWMENKERADNSERQENEKLKKDIKRLSEAAERTSSWSDNVEKSKKGERVSGLRPDRGFIGHKAAKMMKRSKAIENRRASAVDQKSSLLKNIEEADGLKIFPLEYHSQTLVSFSKLSVSFGEKNIFKGLSCNIEQGDRVAVTGPNGSGKSTLLKLIANKLFSEDGFICTGEFILPENLKISYMPQDFSSLPSMSLSEYAEKCGIDESLFKTILRKLDFSRVQLEKNISELSDGQKKKVMLSRSLCEKAHLYVWDEPLNYIDVFSRMQIETLLTEFCPTMIFVEHDRAFAETVATKEIDMADYDL